MKSHSNSSTDNDSPVPSTSLLLFALSAKLWIDRRFRARTAAADDSRRRSDGGSRRASESVRRPEGGDGCPFETAERRIRRNFPSIDSPTLGEPHCRRGGGEVEGRKTRLGRIVDGHDEENDDDGSEQTGTDGVNFLNADCPRWRELMDRISIADSVLTRDASMDFKTKNSNWSHFEGYSYESPTKQDAHNNNIDSSDHDDDQDEDFPWSDPPTSQYMHTRQQANNYTAQHTRQHSANTNANANANGIHSPHQKHPHKHPIMRQSSSAQIRSHNASIMPKTLTLIRHGQSEGNVDEILYGTKPDNAMHLTRLGWDTARMAGKALREQLGEGETVHFVVSPYVRTVETFHGIVSAWCCPKEFMENIHVEEKRSGRNGRLKAWYSKLMEMGLSWHEDPRIREQDFGNYQDPETIRKCKSERHKFGSFYYRFPHGESASDVVRDASRRRACFDYIHNVINYFHRIVSLIYKFDRVSTFLESLWRSFETQKSQNYVLVTHGISIRVFLARYFRYSIDQFNMLANPKNCEMVILKHDGLGRLQLDGRCEMEFETVYEDSEDGCGEECCADGKPANQPNKMPTTRVVGYAKHRRLKLLPPHFIQPRTARLFYGDNGL